MSFLLFLLNPLLGFIRAMKDLMAREAGVVYVLFFALFGYAISFSLDSADSYRIAARFCLYDFDRNLIMGMYRAGEITDVYLLFVYAILKPFTSNPKVLFGVLGSIMGYFSFLSVRQIYKIWDKKKDYLFYTIVFCYFLAISFVNVNGVRFWTATSVFSYYAIQYVYFKNKKAIIGVFCTPLFHFGYMIAVLGLLAYLLIKAVSGNSTKVFFVIMVICFCVSMVTPASFVGEMMGGEDAIETSSGAINTKIQNYQNSEDNIAKYKSRDAERRTQSMYRRANAAYTKAFNFVNKIGVFVLLCMLYRKRRIIVQTKEDIVYFNYVLFMFALGNVAVLLIVSGTRFIVLANLLLLFYMAITYCKNDNLFVKEMIKWLWVINLYAISFLIINAPRLVNPLFWIVPPAITIMDGCYFGPIDYV